MTADERNKRSAGSISMISAKKLRPHPLNPRKKVGDLTELTDSIKKNGILQNLTVVPDPDKDDGYLIVIGHRRFNAGKKAGLTEFPCAIRTLDEADQVRIMLCENIQRNDLTIPEQAAGFQMMIDYGVTVEELSEQTGFARSTIYHRLNIAKLNQNTLKKKLQEITITDLIEMEKIESIDTRNEILKSADRSSIRQKIERAYADQEATKHYEAAIQKCIDAGLERRDTNRWSQDVILVKQFFSYDAYKGNADDFDPGTAAYYALSGNFALFTYRLKDGSAKTRDPEQETLDKERERLMNEVGEQIDKTNEIGNQIYQEICAFEAIVKEGKYDKASVNDFLLSAFRYSATSSYSLFSSRAKEFDPDTYNITTKYSYKGPVSEWFNAMRDLIAAEVGDDPVLYIYIGLRENANSNRNICRGYAAGIIESPKDTMTESAQELKQIVNTLEIIGFHADPDLIQYLEYDNPATRKIKGLADEYAELKKQEK
jgi:ParB family chromosome partitioning protein